MVYEVHTLDICCNKSSLVVLKLWSSTVGSEGGFGDSTSTVLYWFTGSWNYNNIILLRGCKSDVKRGLFSPADDV